MILKGTMMSGAIPSDSQPFTGKIRAATHRDLAILERLMFDLHEEHHQASPEHFKMAAEVMQEKQIQAYLDQPEALIFVAERNTQVVGFVTGHFGEFSSTVSQSVFMGSIDELYVLPESRQQGIGRALLTKIHQQLCDYGVEQLFVEVWAFNQAAVKLYQSLGFNHHIHWLRKPMP